MSYITTTYRAACHGAQAAAAAAKTNVIPHSALYTPAATYEIGIAANAKNEEDNAVWEAILPAGETHWPQPPAPDSSARLKSCQHGGKAVQLLQNSAFAWFLFLPVLALTGCQKSGDSTPLTTAVNAPASHQPESPTAIPADNENKPSQDYLHPQFVIDTTAGSIKVRLDAEKAPLTVDNFRHYVARRHYDTTIFHQVYKTPMRIVLGGVYTADLKEKPALTPIRNEADNGLKNRRGTIAMARGADEDSATCQFFFNLADNDTLNFKKRTPEGYGYCVFGEVTDGIEILDRIGNGAVHDSGKFVSVPVEAVAIKSIRQIK
jgi:cyclophilin family peptidyl-prolyl cis-trans isomerase